MRRPAANEAAAAAAVVLRRGGSGGSKTVGAQGSAQLPGKKNVVARCAVVLLAAKEFLGFVWCFSSRQPPIKLLLIEPTLVVPTGAVCELPAPLMPSQVDHGCCLGRPGWLRQLRDAGPRQPTPCGPGCGPGCGPVNLHHELARVVGDVEREHVLLAELEGLHVLAAAAVWRGVAGLDATLLRLHAGREPLLLGSAAARLKDTAYAAHGAVDLARRRRCCDCL